MKKILIYGDSNTWGDNFILGKRIPDEKQWANILQRDLKDSFKIIQEGLPGRLAGNDEIEKNYKNGKDTFISTFRTQAPVDIIIISLGTNDLQIKYNKDYNKIISDLIWYKDIVLDMYNDLDDRKKYFLNNTMPKFIYILPINFDYKENAKVIFNKESETKRKLILKEFKKYIDDNTSVISIDNLPLFDDGIHLNFDGHKILALRVKETLIMQNQKNELLEFKKRINLQVFGLENIPKTNPSIYIANHNCLMDIFYLAAAIPKPTVSLISPRLIYAPKFPRKQIVNDLLYSMPLEAHGGIKYANICLEQATSILCKNIDISIFPEGAYLEPSNFIYKGRTGAARILFDAKSNGISPNLVPVAIEVKNNNLNLDNYFVCDDIVKIFILPKIDYFSSFSKYLNSFSFEDKNKAFHQIVDKGMKNIAIALNKEYVDEYIELYPKNNVMFSDGTTIDYDIAQNSHYTSIYTNQLELRKNNIVSKLIYN